MSTFIINLNDTIAMSDSAVVELAKVVSACQPCELEAQTNCNDVWIVVAICFAIVAVGLIAKCAVISWKKEELAAAEKEREYKEKEADIAERKKKADAQGKLLDFLKEQVISFDIQKKEYEKAHDNYKDYLESTIKSKQKKSSDEDVEKTLSDTSQSGDELKRFLQAQLVMFAKHEIAYNEACKKYEGWEIDYE